MNRYFFFSVFVFMACNSLATEKPEQNKQKTNTPFWLKDYSFDEKQEKNWSTYGFKKNMIVSRPNLPPGLSQNSLTEIGFIPGTPFVAILTHNGWMEIINIKNQKCNNLANKSELFKSDITNLAVASCTNMMAFTSEARMFAGSITQKHTSYDFSFGIGYRIETLKSIEFNPSATIVAGGCANGLVKTWDIESDKTSNYSYKDFKPIIALAFLDDNILCYNYLSDGIVIRDLRSSQKEIVINQPVQTIAASVNHRFIISGGMDGIVYLYDVRKAKVPCESFPTKTKSPITSLAVYSPFKEFFVGQEDGSFFLIRTNKPEEAYGSKLAHNGAVNAIAIKNKIIDNDYFAASVGHDGTVNLYGPQSMSSAEVFTEDSDKKYNEGTSK